jgi:2-phospho-L-lactate guanylyltransferase (CobY/MobA/RfbA family)
MASVVIPYRGSDPKRRLDPLADELRLRLSEAMLGDVLEAAVVVGRTLVVTSEPLPLPPGVEHVDDPGHGQGAAVRVALDAAAGLPSPYLVVNADLPCVTPRDLLALAGAIPEDGLAIARAADGTTNALGLAGAGLFEPLYGAGSAQRYAMLAPSRLVHIPNLSDDVDKLDDLHRVADRLGPRTRAVVDEVGAKAA